MSTTTYAGIDYGSGQSNIDTKTGIRFGVIPSNYVGEAWYESSEPYYGDNPTCPQCGDDAMGDESAITDLDEYSHYSEYGCDDHYCTNCKLILDSSDASPEESMGSTYQDSEYDATEGSDWDIFITRSPYYTFAQFCSPCAPGAGYLLNPCDTGAKTYCFGHDWFEGGIAPYPVFRVSDNSPVLPENDK